MSHKANHTLFANKPAPYTHLTDPEGVGNPYDQTNPRYGLTQSFPPPVRPEIPKRRPRPRLMAAFIFAVLAIAAVLVGSTLLHASAEASEYRNKPQEHAAVLFRFSNWPETVSPIVVKYTLPAGEHQIFVSKCLHNLPSEDELRDEIKRQYDALEGTVDADAYKPAAE